MAVKGDFGDTSVLYAKGKIHFVAAKGIGSVGRYVGRFEDSLVPWVLEVLQEDFAVEFFR
jgi:hypothetical protein